MRWIHGTVIRNLSKHTQSSGKQIPKIKRFCCGYCLDGLPMNLAPKWVEQNDASLKSPLLVLANSLNVLVRVANQGIDTISIRTVFGISP